MLFRILELAIVSMKIRLIFRYFLITFKCYDLQLNTLNTMSDEL